MPLKHQVEFITYEVGRKHLLQNGNMFTCHKQADVVVWLWAPAQPRILETKQEHNLKALSFSQSNKYVIVAIFRRLSGSFSGPYAPCLLPLRLPCPLTRSFLPSPFCQQDFGTVLTELPGIPVPSVTKPRTLHQKAPSRNNVSHNPPCTASRGRLRLHVHIWAWMDLWEERVHSS